MRVSDSLPTGVRQISGQKSVIVTVIVHHRTRLGFGRKLNDFDEHVVRDYLEVGKIHIYIFFIYV